MNPVLFALDAHIIACAVLSYFCLLMDNPKGSDGESREEDSGVPGAES
ncbi:membrane protein [Mycobacterium phage Lakes]|uniref:Membrane protein n=6 Tax=root TaxID=1 RepID=O64251_BPMD2|nr:membrane protein [Mycobacterium phage D29]YP_008058330.1 hypothetical protein M178_gp56 [Mycobacterium phage Chy5]YP_008060217.1 hypothetical protein M179_gp57 [Mycobacterium phage Chy4]AGK85824.1 hypothetical protein Chy1_0057 [Mycobacterium phage Chy1]AOQ27895.1 hypothetical protein SEA_POMAR16_63 [Mycobacterium phage Pomar16]APC43112.1 hypothetical protein SEA_KERBEROS_64 [Mycobacterium phage Kerberos]APC46181.1 hypothetical protein PBI_STARSTUFF_64 [Mycobacterium phage StarStuff]AXH48